MSYDDDFYLPMPSTTKCQAVINLTSALSPDMFSQEMVDDLLHYASLIDTHTNDSNNKVKFIWWESPVGIGH